MPKQNGKKLKQTLEKEINGYEAQKAITNPKLK